MTVMEKEYRHALEQIAEVKRVLLAAGHALKNMTPATLLVTSAVQGEGKSLVAAALAGTAADSGEYHVAAFDLNWYQPTLHRFFDLDLTHSAQRIFDTDLGDLVCSSVAGDLDILTAPADYAGHPKLVGRVLPMIKRLIAQARESYDLIVIDSAAVFPTNRMMMDPVVLSSLVDGVVMVVSAAATPKQQVRRAQKVMEAAGGNILGVVSNQWRASVK